MAIIERAEPAGAAGVRTDRSLDRRRRLEESARVFVHACKTPSTLRANHADWSDYSRCCVAEGVDALPARQKPSPTTDWMVHAKEGAPS